MQLQPAGPPSDPPATLPRESRPIVLLVDASDERRATIAAMLAPHYTVISAASAQMAEEAFERIGPVCVLIVDPSPDADSMALLRQLQKPSVSRSKPGKDDAAAAADGGGPAPVIVLAEQTRAARAVQLLKAGAQDYLSLTELQPERLVHAIRNAMHTAALQTQLRVHRRELDRQREWLAVTLQSVSDGVITTDTEGRIATLNPVAAQMIGWSVPEVLGDRVAGRVLLVDPQSHDAHPDPVATALAEHTLVAQAAEALLKRRDGALTEVEYCARPIRDREGRVIGAVLVIHDVSQARALAAKMARMAQHDYLTDLPNRMLLTDRLVQAMRIAPRSHQRVAVLFVDLDRFKQVNDALGHEVGDELLRQVARRLATGVRKSDTVSRYGGDEFVVLLPDIEQAQDAAEIAAKLLAATAQPYRVGGHEVRMTFSIGIALHPDDGEEVATLMRHADLAMYEAKTQGRNTFRFFDHQRNLRATQRLSMERGLRGGLKNSEFELYYQPKLRLSDGRVSGCEALIRWHQPGGALAEPASFIPTAEESGLIVPIGLWAVHEACRQGRLWIHEGLSRLPVAVNISATQFHSESFVQDISAILRDTGLPPRWLELELTETTLMRDVQAATDALNLLRSMGIRIAIDDFGTGYCGLAYLKRLPVDTLKIDQSFVHDVPEKRNDAEIISAIVRLGRTLEREIIAEGVETSAQLEFLRALHCDAVQGFLISGPLPATDLARFVRSHPAGH